MCPMPTPRSRALLVRHGASFPRAHPSDLVAPPRLLDLGGPSLHSGRESDHPIPTKRDPNKGATEGFAVTFDPHDRFPGRTIHSVPAFSLCLTRPCYGLYLAGAIYRLQAHDLFYRRAVLGEGCLRERP